MKSDVEEALKSATEYVSEGNAEALEQVKEMPDKMLKCAPETVKDSLAQVRDLNPGLEFKVEGAHYQKSVKDGKVVTPPYFVEDSDEEDEEIEKVNRAK